MSVAKYVSISPATKATKRRPIGSCATQESQTIRNRPPWDIRSWRISDGVIYSSVAHMEQATHSGDAAQCPTCRI